MYAMATIAGTIATDPRVAMTQSKLKVLTFRIAINKNDATIWCTCKFFGKAADHYEGKLAKGMPVSVSGRITPNIYTSQDGTQVTALDMDVSTYCIMHPKPRQQQQQQQRPPMQTSQGGEYYPPQVNNEDIPF